MEVNSLTLIVPREYRVRRHTGSCAYTIARVSYLGKRCFAGDLKTHADMKVRAHAGRQTSSRSRSN